MHNIKIYYNVNLIPEPTARSAVPGVSPGTRVTNFALVKVLSKSLLVVVR